MNGLKTGGRKQGTPNKITNDLRKKLKCIVDNELDLLEKTLNHFEEKERIELLIKLIPYIIPNNTKCLI